MNRRAVTSLVAALLFPLLAYGSAPAYAGASAKPRSVSQANTVLLAASSPFEDMIDYALAGNKQGITQALDAYARQAGKVRQILPQRAQSDIDTLVAEIRSAASRGDYQTAASSAVAAYRILTESLNPNHLVVPKQVSFLDYAGFEFEVLLHAKPMDWRVLEKTANEARQNWATIRSRVSDSALRDAVDLAVAGMQESAGKKNRDLARFAAKMNLAMVDLLEHYFELPRD